MLALPIESTDHKNDAIILILGPENLERMKTGDPAEFIAKQSGKHLVNPKLLICYEEPSPQLTQLLQGGDLRKIIEYLQRGWKFRPEIGDHDNGPQKLSDQ